jgi:CelD/BcsL family acetyltransferase involved in cellulose biosynthesis
VEFGWCKSVNEAASVLTWLFDNKRHWAESRGFKTPYLMDYQVRDYFIALADRLNLSTNPLVVFAKVDGVPIAAALNMVGSRSVESLMTTYDEAYRPYSVGNLLTEYQIKWSHAHGRDFDLRVFYGEYKATWANRQGRFQTRVVFPRARGRLAEFALLGSQAVRAKRKLSNIARDFVHRRRLVGGKAN